MPIKLECFKLNGFQRLTEKGGAYAKALESGLSEHEAARKAILEEHDRLVNDMNGIRTKIGLTKIKTNPPEDISPKIKEIQDEYGEKIKQETDNANKQSQQQAEEKSEPVEPIIKDKPTTKEEIEALPEKEREAAIDDLIFGEDGEMSPDDVVRPEEATKIPSLPTSTVITVSDALQHLVNNKNKFSDLAEQILNTADRDSLDTKVDASDSRKFRSKYLTIRDKILLDKNDAKNATVIIHEIIHATTSKNIPVELKNPSHGSKYGKAYLDELKKYLTNPKADESVKSLIRLYLKAANELGYNKKLFEGGTSVHSEEINGWIRYDGFGGSKISFHNSEKDPIDRLYTKLIDIGIPKEKIEKWTAGRSYGHEIKIDGKYLIKLEQLDSYKNTKGTLSDIISFNNNFELKRNATAGNADLTNKRGVPYGMGNLDEFLAEAFSSESFQKKLASIKDNSGVSLWQRFVDAIKKLVGIDTEGTLLNSVIKTGAEIISKKRDASIKRLDELQSPSKLDLESAKERMRKAGYTDSEIKAEFEKRGLQFEETPPKTPPKQPSETTVDDSEGIGITHKDTEELRKKSGLSEYEKEQQTVEQWKAEATERIKKGELPSLLDKMKKGEPVTDVEQMMMGQHIANLDAELTKNPSKDNLDKLNEAIQLSDKVGGTMWGRSGRARQETFLPDDSLGVFLAGKAEAQGTALTESQIKSESAKYTELKEAKEKLEVELAEEREKYQKLAAEIGVNKAKAAARKASKKSHEDHVKDRKAILDAARADLKKIREQGLHSAIPGLQELQALAPHVKRFMQDLLIEGVDKFDNIVSAIHAEFKDVLDNLRKVDIIDILAGDHDTVKEKTRNEKAAELRLTIREAKLIKELAAERKGEEKAKSERDKVVSNRRIDELTEKIKEVKRLNKEKAEEPLPSEQKLLSDYINKLTQKANKLSKDIKEKKYLEEKPIPPAFKKSRKAQILEDRVIDLENKIRHERSAAEYQKRSKIRKAFDKVMEVLGVRRLVQSAVDISVPFRQGATLISPRNIGIWIKGFKANLQSVFSPKKFERIMYEIRHDPMYHDMIKDKVVFNDMGAADPILHNEDFRKSFVYKIPVISEPLKASNRSADAFLNVARLEIYKKRRALLERQGFTREANPKEFEYIGNWAMSMTGRGRMTNMLENSVAHTVLGNTFYGARLMASRFNLLNPVTYFDPRFSREAKVEAMKDMAAFSVTVMSSALALAAAGGKVSLNPDDSDFLQVRFGKKVYDISGGLAAYVRTFLRIAKAGYTKATGTRYEGKQATDKAALSILRFFRNKLSPNTSYGVNAFFGKDYGQKFDPMEIAAIYPMYADDALKALKEDGLLSLATVLLPNILGIGYGSYASKGQIDANLDDLLQRNLRSDEMNSEKILNFKEGGRPVTYKEFNDFADKRDEEIKKGIEELYNNGIEVIDDNFKIKTKPYKELTQEEVVKETSAIKSKATKKVKLELFGENKKSITDQLKENLLEQHKNIKSLTNGK